MAPLLPGRRTVASLDPLHVRDHHPSSLALDPPRHRARLVGACVAGALWLVACGGSDGAVAEVSANGPADSGKDTPTEQVQPLCGDVSPAAAFHRLGGTVSQAALGPCGHAAWIEQNASLWLANPDLEGGKKVADDASGLVFTASGQRLVYTRKGALVVRDLTTAEERSVPLAGAHGSAALRDAAGKDVIVACDEAGLRLFDGALAQRAQVARADLDCHLFASASSRHAVVAAGSGDKLEYFSIDAETGATRPLTLPAGPAKGGGQLMHQPGLSDDGLVFFRVSQRNDPCGDTVCGTEASIALADVRSGAPIGAVPLAPQPCCGHPPPDGLLAPGKGMHLSGRGLQGAYWVDSASQLHQVGHVKPVSFARDGASFLGYGTDDKSPSPQAARYSTAGGAVVEKLGRADALIVSRNDGAMALDGGVVRCVFYPDKPGTCHEQIWQTRSMQAGAEVLRLESTQPLTPLWVGDDGAVLVAGALFDEPLPEVAAPEQMPEPAAGAHHFVRATGAHVAVDLGTPQRFEPTPRSLLVMSFSGKASTGFSLLALDPSSGAVTTMAQGIERFEDQHGFDAKRERVGWVVRQPDGLEFWAGAVP